jgi:hypothetical protein
MPTPIRLAAFLLFVPALAHAQAVVDNRLVYDAPFFARYSPKTALDMIKETPGFALEETSERRGFAGAAGNILIDGERPIAKSQTLSDILQRIPASQVRRIEIVRDGGRDLSGHAAIANVVRTPAGGEGVYQLGFEHAGRTPMPNGWASWSGRSGATDYSLGVNGYSLSRNLPGDRLLLDETGALAGTRRDTSPRTFYEIGVNGEVSRPMLGGRLRAMGQIYQSRYHENSTIATYDLVGSLTDFARNPYTERKRKLEFGVDFDRPLGPWDLSVSTLLTRNRFTSDIESTGSGSAGAINSVFTQHVARSTGETIARATLARAWGAQRVEAGAEAAVNTLNQRLALTLDLGSGPFSILVPNSNLTVRENRGEAYLMHEWTPKGLLVQTRLAAEISRLSFSGDANRPVRLAYLKPSLQITRNVGARDQVGLHIYRDVGQLDFLDFVSVASLTDKRINGGNPELKPETSWRAELSTDLRFGSEGALNLTLFRYWLSDAKDLVAVGSPGNRIDAPGNIGRGRVDGFHANIHLPLKAILQGASLTLDGTWRRSRITDPLNGQRRELSNYEHRLFKAEFRQDLARRKFSWGATYTDKPWHIFYRSAEIERDRDSPSLDLWLETTAFAGLRTRLTILSLLGQPQVQKRIFYSPDRTGDVASIELTRRHPGRWLTLTISGSL